MLFKRLIIISSCAVLVSGCAEFYGSQPPAPLHGEQQQGQQQATAPRTKKKSKAHKAETKEVVKTKPLKDISTIKSESLTPLETTPLEQSIAATPSEPIMQEPLESASPSAPAVAPVPSAPAQEPAPAPRALTPFVPIEPTVSLSPVVGALVSAAKQNSQAGDLDSAAASIERAIRIEPRNATLFYKLALLRIKQAKPRLAEDLAKKSALLASTDNTLKKHCWLLIAHAREIQQDFAGAKEAREKAEGF